MACGKLGNGVLKEEASVWWKTDKILRVFKAEVRSCHLISKRLSRTVGHVGVCIKVFVT